jgi:hypothetical protein
MTVTTLARRIAYAGDGSARSFAVPFGFADDAALRVVVRSAAGAETLQTLNVDYTVSRAVATPGGTVVFGTAPAAGSTVSIRRQTARTQSVDYVPNDPFPAQTHEDALDRLTQIAQEVDDDVSRALLLPETDPALGATLPPASARAGRFLGFDGAGAPVALTGTAGADSALRSDLATAALGAALIAYLAPGAPTAAARTLADALTRGATYVVDYRLAIDADDTAAWQRALDACPAGGCVQAGRGHLVSAPLQVRKPVTIRGTSRANPALISAPPAPQVDDADFTVRMTTPSTVLFSVIPGGAAMAYYAGQIGAFGVTFTDLKLLGSGHQLAPAAELTGAAIRFDMSLAAGTTPPGNVHFRHIDLDRVCVRFFDRAVDAQGIAYINTIRSCVFMDCNWGLHATKAGAADNGGQTNILDSTMLFQRQGCVFWDYPGGSLRVIGSTLSESAMGLHVHEETILVVMGCEIENLKQANYPSATANAAGLYIEIAEANPNSSAPKLIIGNKFLFNDRDILLRKTSTGFAQNMRFAMEISANAFLSTKAVEYIKPGGHDSLLLATSFALSNTGTSSDGMVADSQLVGITFDVDGRLMPWRVALARARGRPLVYRGAGAGDVVLTSVDVPNGATLWLEDIERHSVNATTGARSAANLFAIDAGAVQRIAGFGTGYVPALSWTNGTGSAQTVRIVANDGGSGLPYYVGAQVRVT